ncbi:MAG: hypothetical protein H7A38_06735 [Chlamydiales bacterium]|nr:hypothetical protein [Chlamydiales bacterium]
MTALQKVYSSPENQASIITQGSLDVGAATLGLLVLKAAGLKFEVGQLPMKSLLMHAGLAGLFGAGGRELLNYFCPATDRRKPDQNSSPLKLGALAAFAIGAIVLSQYERARSISYAGRVISSFPQFASRNQMIVIATLSTLSMVGARFFFGNTETQAEKEPQVDQRPLFDVSKYNVDGIDKLSLEQMQQIDSELAEKGRCPFQFTMEQKQAWNARVDALRADESTKDAAEILGTFKQLK